MESRPLSLPLSLSTLSHLSPNAAPEDWSCYESPGCLGIVDWHLTASINMTNWAQNALQYLCQRKCQVCRELMAVFQYYPVTRYFFLHLENCCISLIKYGVTETCNSQRVAPRIAQKKDVFLFSTICHLNFSNTPTVRVLHPHPITKYTISLKTASRDVLQPFFFSARRSLGDNLLSISFNPWNHILCCSQDISDNSGQDLWSHDMDILSEEIVVFQV